jgi:hypothetical protein
MDMAKITISSRYNDPKELRQMIGWLNDFGLNDFLTKISLMFCDSKAGSAFQFEFNETCDAATAYVIIDSFSLYMRNEHQGHNGIWANQHDLVIEPMEGK